MHYEHEGHRQRLLAKVAKGECSQQELVEVMLFFVLPRRNTSDLAHRLLDTFGSPHGVFLASFEELCEVEGIGEGVARKLCCIGLAYRECMQEALANMEPEKKERRFLTNYDVDTFVKQYEEYYCAFDYEVLDLYLLDGEGKVFDVRRITQNAKGGVRVPMKTLIDIFMEESPAGIVLAHNHPNGRVEPSAEDESFTRTCLIACGVHGVLMCDHIIYAKNKTYSYYQTGELKRIAEKHSLKMEEREKV